MYDKFSEVELLDWGTKSICKFDIAESSSMSTVPVYFHWNSLQVLVSSHPCHWNVIKNMLSYQSDR